jgi:signal transduction histidine kinase
MFRNIFFVFFLFLLLLFSCNNKENEQRHIAGIDSIIKIADVKLRDNFEVGTQYFDSAYNAFPNVNEHDIYRKEFIKASVIFLNKKLDSALLLINGALEHLDQQLYQFDLMKAYILKANILLAQENFDDAFKYYYLAKVISDKEKTMVNQKAWLNASIANVLFIQKKYNESRKYFYKAYELYSKVNSNIITENLIPQQLHLNNVALCYERLNDLKNAELTYKKALDLTKKSNSTNYEQKLATAKSIILGNLGSVYFKQGDYLNAEKALKESLALNKEEKNDEFFTKIKLATLYIEQNRNEEVQLLINDIESYDKFYLKKSFEVRKRLFELAYKYNEHINNYSKAYVYFKKYHHLKDSLDIFSNRLQNRDLNKEFIKFSQANTIENLQKKNELKSVYLILTIGLSTLSLLSIFLILKNVNNSKKHIKKLTILNSKISGHNEMMQKTLSALEQSQEQNTHMMQVVAHDMRTPIAGVIGLTSFMLEEDDLNEEQREIISMINTSGADTLNFINDLLQAQYQKSNLIKEPVGFHTLIKYCITLLESKAKEKNQQLKSKTFPIEINISREKIWRVMSNLISNAIKFSAQGTTINIIMEEKPLSILVKVKDNGIGIPQELADKLFDMNAEVQREGTDGEKSYGMGLAICKQIVEAHNGSIWFESVPGIGTTFFVELPINES